MSVRAAMEYVRKIGLVLSVAVMPVWFGGCSSGDDLRWEQEDGHRWAAVSPGFRGRTGFELLDPHRTNVHFANRLTDEHIAENRNLLNGSGVAAGDVDDDGFTDLYFAQLDGPNHLYRNLGNFEFVDVTREAGVAHDGYYSTGVVFADVDGDGDLDLLVGSLGGDKVLYLNDGNGRFAASAQSRLEGAGGSSTMALADIDGDRDLDLYVAHYKEKSVKDIYDPMEITWERTARKRGGGYELAPPFDQHFVLIDTGHGPDRRELATRDELYINRGDGTFERDRLDEDRFRSEDGAPLGLARDWGLTARFQDINDDGHPDLYVCNDFWTPDRVWINRGDGTFRAVGKLAIRSFSFSSMAVDFSDIDRDGLTDYFVTEMLSPVHETRLRQVVSYSPFVLEANKSESQPLYMRNTLYLNRGDDTFAEIAHFSGVEATGWSWATRFLDVDLDGYEDLIVNTGHAHDVLDLDTQERLAQVMARRGQAPDGYVLEYPALKLANVAFRNNGDLTFTDKSAEWGFTEEDISHGFATADLDNDGDLDVVVNRLNAPAAVYRNESTAPRIAVRLNGRSPNTQGIGAKVALSGGPVAQRKEIVSGGEYLSGSDPMIVFAADAQSSDHVLTVRWPGGAESVIDSVAADRIYEIEEPDSSGPEHEARSKERDVRAQPFFEDVSGRLNHSHIAEAFNDFNLQRLVPVRLSRSGPGIIWIDFDSDGDDDVMIGADRGGRIGVYENLGDGQFRSAEIGILTDETAGDITAIIGWEEAELTRIVVGHSTYKQDSTGPAAVDYRIQADAMLDAAALPRSGSSTGPLAAADYDGDGDLDLFVGGRLLPGRYPADAGSRLFRNDGETFRIDDENADQLRDVGMITDAVFSDYDGDGDQDLICSLEWGPIRLFKNESGRFRDDTAEVGLDRYAGWWNGIATGDLNSDGRPDIVATNLGLNSVYQRHISRPLRIYYGDFDSDGDLDLVESYFDDGVASYVPRRGLYELRDIQTITRNLTSHRQYASSSVVEILGGESAELSFKSINVLEHTLFINRPTGFEAHPLPKEAQMSAAFYAGVADFDNDGREDVFLSQNLFAVPPLTPRLDAGRGLWLRGDGNGRLEAVDGDESGVKIYGQQRGAALGDYNGDGRVDLAVSQNGGETKLYVNRVQRRGLRIRLRGPAPNRNGIGSSVRLIYEDGSKGPRREVQSGSGYLSQNSTTQVLGTAARPVQIEVTWFDGTQQMLDVSSTKSTFDIAYPGEGRIVD